MRIPAPHIEDELDLFGCMLVWMTVGTVGAVGERLHGAVVAFPPAVDVLPVQLVTDRSPGHSVFVGIFKNRLPKPHRLCYCIHCE